MKILISSDLGFPYLGGAERATLNISKGLIERNHEVTWVSSKIKDTGNRENLHGIKIQRVNVPFDSNYMLARGFYPANSFYTLLKEAKKADIIQFCTIIGALNGNLIGRLSKKPYLCQTWELLGSLWDEVSGVVKSRFYQAAERYIANSYPFFIAISNYTKRMLMKYGASKDKIKVVYLGVDHKQFYYSKPEFKIKSKFVLGWCGRMKLSVTKNLPALIEAFKLVKEEVDSVLLLAGNDFDSLLPLFKKHNLKVGKDVIYLGKLPDEKMKNFYSSLDVYALPSLSEGFGLVALEAQACGTPVVCFDVGSLPEVVSNNKTGIVVKKTEAKEFAENILKAKDRKFDKREVIRSTEKFTWDKTVKEQLKVYEMLSGKK